MRINETHMSLIGFVTATFMGLEGPAQTVPDGPRVARYRYPAKDVAEAVWKSGDRVEVTEAADHFHFVPSGDRRAEALLFFPGGGVEPTAYAPLVRGLADAGIRVCLVRLPVTLAPPDKHKQNAIAFGRTVIKGQADIKRWVVGGHSMGGAIAAQFVRDEPGQFRGLILIGTTHPRDFDLSGFAGDVTKVYGTADKVAKLADSEANRKLLPEKTTWVRVEGGNHAQFGFYGSQPGDGPATISREKQHLVTSEAVVKAMLRVAALPAEK